MNRTDFYKMFATENGVSQDVSKEICLAMFDLLNRCVRSNERVYIKGFGTFRKKAVKEKRVHSVQGGEPCIIPAGEKIVFKPYSGAPEE